MDNNIKFLDLFIKKFCFSGIRKRATSNNIVHQVKKKINWLLQKHFDNKFEYSEEEIIDSFIKNGYSIIDNSNNGKISFDNGQKYYDIHVIIDTKELQIFRQVNFEIRKGWNDSTIEKADKLKEDLKLFWEEHKNLVS